MNDHNKKMKREIGNTLKKSLMQIGDKCVPILTKSTKQIVIICNDGEVAQIDPLLSIK
jgi:hypothetical protein